ncbi:Ferric reductase like transmembrane component [Yamadazyma tenuis]|uniref:Probable metalloreductase AIM14 n=1 Tax=Candida tenuis (strain ATCC 10573 / BCRC 21748 / CBS 615 / JCM 9827 / NBRC 10315 / NRRL Y-1498 / VKM Y-70) TaxID=590646 RepID=G3AWQ4_CANTC|nr:uncharacterized protein CANTEDRAFT_112306 [Yamadazyma tenuis ATCC 10573]XP_006684094.1 uncharacterized protein CANTEDRAFT_112306 [Yamadazyma tenuis ATCC 10573]EGV66835.1 hypothetical protein CANTEDRAFT_112306 [Yamadazyma tenuis ATCC 10573]EGV66836.1 hypothetical protein CANTEDRAFT_112306 [Yamadazyma tenuis ATCC 10573]WEJ95284.1 Ferric reductase like transmembrane component [Yamadazyma tenuis]
MSRLLQRHEGEHHKDSHGHGHNSSHYANIKWGYILLAGSLVYFAVFLAYERRRPKYSKPFKISTHIALWISATVGLCANLFPNIVENSSTLLKRFGRFSYVLTTVDLLLALRPNLLNYVYLVELHKWMSRYVIVLGIVHSVGFLVRWLVMGQLFKVLRLLNLLGVAIFLMFVVLLVLSIKVYRNKYYNTFYVIHNLTLVCYLGLINYHARPGVTWLTMLNLFLVTVQIVFKFNITRIASTSVKNFGSLTLVTFEKPINYPITTPGSHLVLQLSRNWRQWIFPAHPYTIINNNEYLNLVVTNINRFKFDVEHMYTISFPYSSSLSLMEFEGKNVLMVIGGSGISYAISILNFYKTVKINFRLVWVVRDKRDLALIKEFNLNCQVDLYVTGSVSSGDMASELGEQRDGLLHNIEMDEFEVAEDSETPEIMFARGRPQISDFQVPDLLIACGPDSLIYDAQAFATANNVNFLKEFYNY